MIHVPMFEKKTTIDISILQKEPVLDRLVELEIQPLAPLSMVSELPGSYYKTLKVPDHKMLCGLFENVLGWHIDLADRKQIFKELVELRKKLAKREAGTEMRCQTKGSTYLPLLMDYFVEIEQPFIPENMLYDDLWSRAFRRTDATAHPKGTFNIDYNLIPLKREIKRNDKNPKQFDEKALEAFFKDHLGQFPLYYSTPTTREYISVKGKYKIQINMDSSLYGMLYENLLLENIGYLGNNEGWVYLTLKKLW